MSGMSKNIIKVRDDRVCFKLNGTESDELTLVDEQLAPSWLSKGKDGTIPKSSLRAGIEPWLTSLFQSEQLSLLVGSGLSSAIQVLATGSSSDAMSNPSLEGSFATEVEAFTKVSAERFGRGEANIEDYIRTINELLRGLEILGHDKPDDEEKNASYKELSKCLEETIQQFANNISSVENSIVSAQEKERNDAFDCLINFLMSFASRTGTRDRLNIFTTNYDRIIEAGAEIAGLHLVDRFVGSLAPIFRSSRLDIDMHYNPPGIRGEPRYLEGVARFTKLHGSLDWVDTGEEIRRIGLPFGSTDRASFLNAPGLYGNDVKKTMIYPNAAKDRETTEYPYVELFRDFAASLCRPNSTLVTYGYSFGDDHINRIVRDMLTIPSTHLVIIAYDDNGNRIIDKFKEFGRPSQISLLIGNDIANLPTLVEYFLPKPSIDRTSIRMSELLKQRYTTQNVEATDKANRSEAEQ